MGRILEADVAEGHGRDDGVEVVLGDGDADHRDTASFSCTLPIMPRDGALILSEVRVPVLSVVCEPCGRPERYDVERLMRQYGWDAKLTDLLPALVADCPK